MTVRLTYETPPAPIRQSSLSAYQRIPGSVDSVSLPSTWGQVEKVYDDCTADVRIQGGAILPRVPVASTGEFIYTKDGKTFGTKKLPPVGTRVIVDFLDGMVRNAVVRGSLFSRIESSEQVNILEDGKATVDTAITENGFKETSDQDTGNYLLEDPDDADFHVKIDKVNKIIEIQDWNGNKIKMAGSLVEINGNSKEVVTHAELTTIMATFMTALNARFSACQPGAGSPGGLTLDISSAKSTKVKVG